jgi:ribosomal protein S27AE
MYKNKNDLYRNQVARWIKIKQKAIDYKRNICEDCGNSFPYPAMHFHHTDVHTKEVTWTKLRLRSWDKIILELDKCILLCANCHAIRHSLLSN